MPPTDDDHETVRNEERGCGFLKHSKAYVRSPPRSADGVLPSFVEFSPPIPYLERAKFRGYEFFPGTEFELSVTGASDFPTTEGGWTRPSEIGEGDETPALQGVSPEADDGMVRTDPPGEIWRHILRTTGSAHDYEHAGQVPQFQSRDLFMLVGKSYYDTPEEFIEEVHEQGLSKAIPVSETQDPPRIDPGRTRLYLVHPKAVYYEETDTYKAGIIGYVYLHRTIYTEDEKGRFPAWAEEQASGREDMDLVRIGDQIYEDGTRATTINGAVEDDDEESPRSETESEPVSVQASDKPGRDVETVPDEDSGLDEEAVLEQLDDAEDEIREFSEDYYTVEGASLIQIPSPDECPECGEPTSTEEMGGGEGTVHYCPSCGWDNSQAVNASFVEVDYRNDYTYQELRTLVSEKDLSAGQNPDTDDLLRVLLKDMGLL